MSTLIIKTRFCCHARHNMWCNFGKQIPYQVTFCETIYVHKTLPVNFPGKILEVMFKCGGRPLCTHGSALETRCNVKKRLFVLHRFGGKSIVLPF